MSDWRGRLARGITAFVENPITNLVKGIALLAIGLADASHSLRDDLANGRVRAGHGMVILGLFGILGALPHLLEGLEASSRYLAPRGKDDRAANDGAER
jgi:hypothetical protein